MKRSIIAGTARVINLDISAPIFLDDLMELNSSGELDKLVK